MSKYSDLVRVLDSLRMEAPSEFPIYNPDSDNLQAVEQARSRAYIHLFLKAKFGLLSFEEREHFVTDGSADGGIDAYYIDREHKSVFFIQSKFRNTDSNFEEKTITYSELLSMDVARITQGHDCDEHGEKYNPKFRRIFS